MLLQVICTPPTRLQLMDNCNTDLFNHVHARPSFMHSLQAIHRLFVLLQSCIGLKARRNELPAHKRVVHAKATHPTSSSLTYPHSRVQVPAPTSYQALALVHTLIDTLAAPRVHAKQTIMTAPYTQGMDHILTKHQTTPSTHILLQIPLHASLSWYCQATQPALATSTHVYVRHSTHT